MAKVILLSQFPLPYSKIGSWTTLYANYIQHHQHKIDYVVCPKPKQPFQQVQYSFIGDTFRNKVSRKFFGKSYSGYFDALKKIFKPYETYVIQVADNQGLIKPLVEFLNSIGIRNRVYIQYFHHGFSPLYTNQMSGPFFDAIDEIVLLTHDSYKFYQQYYTVFPSRVSILHNGIDTSKFYRPSSAQKRQLKSELGISAGTTFIWCAKDRPKKGLDLLLDAWKRIYSQDKDIALLVVGSTRTLNVEGVMEIGVVPNDQLPKYFQASDVYLFPTLCKEGFGMTLIEALHCGNYCIAAANGGVPEVLQYGKLGQLVDSPNKVADWVSAIEEYLQTPPVAPVLPDGLYTMEAWNHGMDEIIDNAKISIQR
ncbi:MAG TPA: glycosyltransferase family 4 protein [Flavobacterium sp.]|jgi:glycosyltransferase involved in cell wall biosynthesis